jgi:hypothetical protein
VSVLDKGARPILDGGLRIALPHRFAAQEVPAMSASLSLSPLAEIELPCAFARLRREAAQVRALLVELDRRIPLSVAGRSAAAQSAALGEQIAEEVGRLAVGMLDCAAALTDLSSNPAPSKVEAVDAPIPCWSDVPPAR